MARKHLIHAHSSVVTNNAPKLPNPLRLEYGEIAVNFAEDYETISIKNDNDSIVTFSSDKHKYYEISYSQLKSKRDNSKLKPGALYRINDYTATTVQQNTQSANHQFDIVVQAISPNQLSENAKAVKHDSDTYFVNSNLDAWEIKYTIDNDSTKFAWADSSNGKGVIYYMKDEWNNECPYDFKNLQFKRWKIMNVTYDSSYDTNFADAVSDKLKENLVSSTSSPSFNTKYSFLDSNFTYGFTFDVSNDYEWYYTFSTIDITAPSNTPNNDITVIPNNSCIGNTIKPYYDQTARKFKLNNITFNGYDVTSNNETVYKTSYNNLILDNCYDMTFGYECSDNVIMNNSHSNIFVSKFHSNFLGYGSERNVIGSNSSYNHLGNLASLNIILTSDKINTGDGFSQNILNESPKNDFGDTCTSNLLYWSTDCKFGNACQQNFLEKRSYGHILGHYCCRNHFRDLATDYVFGYGCSDNDLSSGQNTFGNVCTDNHIEGDCQYNTFGNDCSGIVLDKDTRYCIFENGCKEIQLTTNLTMTQHDFIQNITVSQGVSGTTNNKKVITHPTINDDFKTTYQSAQSSVVNV